MQNDLSPTVNHFTYEIVEGNEEGKFLIDPATGDVLVNKPLDYDHPVLDRNVSTGASLPSSGVNLLLEMYRLRLFVPEDCFVLLQLGVLVPPSGVLVPPSEVLVPSSGGPTAGDVSFMFVFPSGVLVPCSEIT